MGHNGVMTDSLPKDVRCPSCGYDMSGLPSWVCPECGEDQSQHEEASQARVEFVSGPFISRRVAGYAVALPFVYVTVASVGLMNAGLFVLLIVGAVLGIGVTVGLGEVIAWSAYEHDRDVVRRVWMQKLWVLHLPWVLAPATSVLIFVAGAFDSFATFVLGMGAALIWSLFWLFGLFIWFGESVMAHKKYGVRDTGRLSIALFICGLLTLAATLAMSLVGWHVTLLAADFWFPQPFLEGWEDF